MSILSGDIRKAGLKAGVPEGAMGDFVDSVHMKIQYIPKGKAIESAIREFRQHEVIHPGHRLEPLPKT